MERKIPDETWAPLAQSLNVSVAALRAVAAVESAGDGFLVAPPELPKILFEGHAFHRLTQGRFDAAHPTLSYPKWTKQFYSKTGAGEWNRLNAACALDRRAALQSASWGMFQIMGFNYALCGYTDVVAFVAQQKAGAAEQLECFVRFISHDIFLSPLRERRWAAFARAYNGPGYKLNQYDTKLAAAYAVFAKPQAKPTAAAMKKLKERGFDSPYLRPFVVARINPIRFKRGTADAHEVIDTMLASARKFDAGGVRADQVAKAGGAPEES